MLWIKPGERFDAASWPCNLHCFAACISNLFLCFTHATFGPPTLNTCSSSGTSSCKLFKLKSARPLLVQIYSVYIGSWICKLCYYNMIGHPGKNLMKVCEEGNFLKYRKCNETVICHIHTPALTPNVTVSSSCLGLSESHLKWEHWGLRMPNRVLCAGMCECISAFLAAAPPVKLQRLLDHMCSIA